MINLIVLGIPDIREKEALQHLSQDLVRVMRERIGNNGFVPISVYGIDRLIIGSNVGNCITCYIEGFSSSDIATYTDLSSEVGDVLVFFAEKHIPRCDRVRVGFLQQKENVWSECLVRHSRMR